MWWGTLTHAYGTILWLEAIYHPQGEGGTWGQNEMEKVGLKGMGEEGLSGLKMS